MFGEIGAWFFKGLGGILPDTAAPGFRHILLHPHIIAELDHFTATHRSPYGWIRSGWKHEKGQLIYFATIPAGSTATLKLAAPDQPTPRTLELSAGDYYFRYDAAIGGFVKIPEAF
jgi:alpha-L-rhamnosidase